MNRLVVAVAPARHVCLERAEVADQVRPAELVVEGRRADRPSIMIDSASLIREGKP